MLRSTACNTLNNIFVKGAKSIIVPGIFLRGLAEGTNNRKNTVKSALHSLYKLVHPDLFSNFPAEKAENERSLKLLQEYVSRSQSLGSGSLAYSTIYNFVFFLKDSVAPESGSTHKAQAGPQLRRVALTLPPPSPTLSDGQLSLTGRKGLSRLLQVCGLPELDIFEGGNGGPITAHLLAFLPEAVEEARLKERNATQSGIRIANIRGAMRFARKVLVTVEKKNVEPRQQTQLLEALARVLDAMPALDVSGLRIVLSDRTGISPAGSLLLDTQEDEDEWAYFLEQVDLNYCRQLLERLKEVKRLEQMVAESIGVGMVYTTPNAHLHADYRVFLERVSSHAGVKGAVQGVSLNRVPVMVIPAMAGSAGGPMSAESATDCVDTAMGFLRVSVLAEPSAVYDIIQVHGPQAVALLERNESRENYESIMTSSARSMLHLRRLHRDPSISHEQYIAACKRLTANRAVLADLLDGQSVRISDASRVAADGSHIDIDWDFDM